MTRADARRLGVARVALILATVCLTSVGFAGPASAHGGTTYVKPGQKIQDAINAADPGDRIVVKAGTYAEQLVIKTDGISLVGLGAVLVPPSPMAQISGPKEEAKDCSGLAGPITPGGAELTQAGICVLGDGVQLAEFVTEHRKVISVGRPVKDVSITGFQVHGFSGENIAVVGAQDARVAGNRLVDGDNYGFLTVGSTNTRVTANTVTSSKNLRFIGICMDNKNGVQVSNNSISGYVVALCVQTNGADVRNNNASGNCVGVYVDPGIKGAEVRGNHISASNSLCSSTNSFGVYGIIIDGAVNTEVRYNRIEGQRFSENGVGVAVVDSGAVASDNLVTQNWLFNNDTDLVNASNTSNVFVRNKCESSYPVGLCH